MATIKLSEGYKLVSEGTHTFTVKSVEYKPDYKKVNIKMETESGEKHTEFFTIDNDKALFAFTMTAKVLMGNNELTEIDPEKLVGKKMVATVTHNVAEKTGKKYAALTDKKAIEGATEDAPFDTDDTSSDDDLDDLFDDI